MRDKVFSLVINICLLTGNTILQEDTTRLIWAYGNRKSDITYHGVNNRGSKSVYLLDSPTIPQEEPGDMQSYDFVYSVSSWIKNYTITFTPRQWLNGGVLYIPPSPTFIISKNMRASYRLSDVVCHELDLLNMNIKLHRTLSFVLTANYYSYHYYSYIIITFN